VRLLGIASAFVRRQARGRLLLLALLGTLPRAVYVRDGGVFLVVFAVVYVGV